jgi:hypothetical protein
MIGVNQSSLFVHSTLQGIISILQNKESMLKIIINKYVTKLKRHWL